MHAEEGTSLAQSKSAEVNLVIEGDKVLQHHFRIPNHGRRLKLVYSRPLLSRNSVSTLSSYSHCICMYACQADLFFFGMHTCTKVKSYQLLGSVPVITGKKKGTHVHRSILQGDSGGRLVGLSQIWYVPPSKVAAAASALRPAELLIYKSTQPVR